MEGIIIDDFFADVIKLAQQAKEEEEDGDSSRHQDGG